eukprot:CAMPEP_0117695336 /NCGR_PEP_ID=MMETSP0804-20121206/28088_1 /TAXON_ID=1074897 /ORGANISM="Tetraselmis astigmatica, Strain CCMP880" /LENGTH=305 /DNA_ID=CAMNT_0005509407 /DNA_START=50 /DNA_END=964 /DNA_ORIENTATION=-
MAALPPGATPGSSRSISTSFSWRPLPGADRAVCPPRKAADRVQPAGASAGDTAAAAQRSIMPPWAACSFMEEGVGWAVTLVVLAAARLARTTAVEEVMRAPSNTEWLIKQGRYRALSANPEVLARQREYEALNSQEKQGRAERSLRQARERQKAEGEARRERERKYREEAEKETARLKAQLEAQKKAFEEKEAAMAAELNARIEKEKQIMEEQAAKRRTEREAQRQKEEEERQRLEEAKQREEERQQAELEEARRAAAEEAAKLKKMAKSFAVTLEGTVSVAPPPAGALTEGPLEREAVVQVVAA